MATLSDQTMIGAFAGGEGAYDGLKLAQWLYEAVAGAPMPEALVARLAQGGQTGAAARRGVE